MEHKVFHDGVLHEGCLISLGNVDANPILLINSASLSIGLKNPFISKIGGTELLLVDCHGNHSVFSILPSENLCSLYDGLSAKFLVPGFLAEFSERNFASN